MMFSDTVVGIDVLVVVAWGVMALDMLALGVVEMKPVCIGDSMEEITLCKYIIMNTTTSAIIVTNPIVLNDRFCVNELKTVER